MLKKFQDFFDNSNNQTENKDNEDIPSDAIEKSVKWHNYTIAEVLLLSKSKKWNDVRKDMTNVILSLSNHNATDISDDTNDANTQRKQNELQETMENEFTCPICMDCFIEPLTISCGHTFCRLCMIQIQSKCDKKCPICKAVCHINPMLHPTNIAMNNCSQKIFQNHYNERILELRKLKAELDRELPVFVFNQIRFPGMILSLHLFEPRYLHMIKKAVECDNRFVYLCRTVNYRSGPTQDFRPYAGDVALVVHVNECNFFPDGRCLMKASCEKRISVVSAWIEHGTQGLWHVRYSDYMEPPDTVHMEQKNDDNNNDNGGGDGGERKMMEVMIPYIQSFVGMIYSKSNAVIKALENECGERVCLTSSNLGKWAHWLCSLLYITNIVIKEDANGIKWIREQYKEKCYKKRIKKCYDQLLSQEKRWKSSL